MSAGRKGVVPLLGLSHHRDAGVLGQQLVTCAKDAWPGEAVLKYEHHVPGCCG